MRCSHRVSVCCGVESPGRTHCTKAWNRNHTGRWQLDELCNRYLTRRFSGRSNSINSILRRTWRKHAHCYDKILKTLLINNQKENWDTYWATSPQCFVTNLINLQLFLFLNVRSVLSFACACVFWSRTVLSPASVQKIATCLICVYKEPNIPTIIGLKTQTEYKCSILTPQSE